MTSPVAHECSSGKGPVGRTETRERALPIPSPAFLGSVLVPVTLAVPKQFLLCFQPATLGRRTRGLERLSQMS